MNYKADEFDYEAEYQRLRRSVSRANILLLGASGAGKSSVINHVFGREMTQAGPGQPVTRGIIPCFSDDMPVVLYDTEGYTAGAAAMDAFSHNVLDFADRLAAERPGDLSARIHIAWYCISLAQKRVTDADVRLTQSLRDRGIPVCLVLTHADAADAQELAAMQRALTDLEREGLLYSQRTAGRFVTDETERIRGKRRELAMTQVQNFLTSMKEMGFSAEETVEMIEQVIRKEEEK